VLLVPEFGTDAEAAGGLFALPSTPVNAQASLCRRADRSEPPPSATPTTPTTILGVGAVGAAVMLRSEDALFHNGRSRDILYGRPCDISLGWLDLRGGGQRTLRRWIGHNLTVRDGA
jgi:hypothetical protein